jgi:broad specificity phosphatase PhoE
MRSAPALDRLARAHPDRELIIVSHGGVMRTLWAHVTGSWEGSHIPANCGIVVVEHDAGRYLVPRVLEAASDGEGESGG